MPFTPAENTVLVLMNYDWDGQRCDNTLWFKKRTGAPDVESMIALGDALNTYWLGNMVTRQSEEVAFRGCVIIDQTTETGVAVEVGGGTDIGGIASPALPNNVTFVITFLTAARGKSSRGRNYFIGIPNTEVVQNTISLTYANQLLTAYQGILSSDVDVEWEWSVVSHFTAGDRRVTALVQPIIGARYHDLTVDSQRRRLPGRGT